MHSGPNSLLLQNAVVEADRAKRREGLWWSMLKVPNAACPTPVVRNWATRRVRDAFVRALRQKGLGEDGLVVKGRNGTERQRDGNGDVGIGSNFTAPHMQSGGSESIFMSRTVGQTTLKQPRQPRAVIEMQGSLVLRVELQAAKATSQQVEEEARALVDWLYQNGVPAGSALLR